MRNDVIVIGGGVSGLAAAVRLASSGVRVRLLEARGVLGGRATSYSDPRTGEVFDNGQHALMGCYRETFLFLDAIGARDLVEVSPSLDVTSIDEAGVRSDLRCPQWPPPLHLLGGVLTWTGVSWRDRLQLVSVGPALLRARRAVSRPGTELPCAPGETVLDWLVRHGQGPRLRALLWEPLAVAALNQPIESATADTFVRVLGRVFGPGRTDASVVLPKVPLARLFGDPAKATLESLGSRVELDALARVVVSNGRVQYVTVRGEEAAAPAQHVVLATPWHTWTTTVTGETSPISETLQAARRTDASAIVTVTLTFDRPVLSLPMVGLPARPFQWAFDTAALGGSAPGARVALVSSGAEAVLRLSNAAAASLARDVFGSAMPAARAATLVSARVIREPRATFSLAPGQPPRPGTRTAVAGLYLASDWVDTGLPATIEGAVEAGHRAADAVLADLGVSRTPSGHRRG